VTENDPLGEVLLGLVMLAVFSFALAHVIHQNVLVLPFLIPLTRKRWWRQPRASRREGASEAASSTGARP